MILTPIRPEDLQGIVHGFVDSLGNGWTRSIAGMIVATSPRRAGGATAKRHQSEAVALSRRFGMANIRLCPSTAYHWDGTRLYADTEAYVLLHEIAHYQLAAPNRRRMIDFGLGAGPDTGDREGAERATMLTGLAREAEEAAASLLGILWEVAFGHPALASFLDQNWLEGAGKPSAADHFTNLAAQLKRSGFIGADGRPTLMLREEPDAFSISAPRLAG